MEKKKEEKQLSAVELFYRKRKKDEPDLHSLASMYIKSIVGERALSIFNADPMIISIGDLNPNSQRININRWLIHTLLVFRAKNDNVDINSVLGLVTNESSIEDWATILKDLILPFFKENKVLGE